MSKTLVNKTEAARSLSICGRTLDNLVAQDKIRSHRVGTRRLFDLEEVIEDIKAGKAAVIDHSKNG